MPSYHIIIDLEMNPTSEILRGKCHGLKTETIEMGAIKIDASTNQVIDTFSCVICPQLNKRIEPQITKLTGITTREAKTGLFFEEALDAFITWVGHFPSRIYSWSHTDLAQLTKECAAKHIPFPQELCDWVDFQAEYPKYLGYSENRCLSLKDAAKLIGTSVSAGKAHRALYDAQITSCLVLFVLTEEYKTYKSRMCGILYSSEQPLSCSIGDACNGKLAALLARMKSAENKGEETYNDSRFAGTVPVYIR